MSVKNVKIERESDSDLGYPNKALAHITGRDGKITRCSVLMTSEQIKDLLSALHRLNLQARTEPRTVRIFSNLSRVYEACKALELETLEVPDITDYDKQTMLRMDEAGIVWIAIANVFCDRYPGLTVDMLHKIMESRD